MSRKPYTAMKPKPTQIGLFILGLSVGIQPVGSLAQGSLSPPGAPAPMMKTLAQIEPRTLLTNTPPDMPEPIIITNPGSYYIVTNILGWGGDAIIIATNNVTLDLNGWGIRYRYDGQTFGAAIRLGDGVRNVTIKNGYVDGGYYYGIACGGTNYPRNIRIQNVSVRGSVSMPLDTLWGISLLKGCKVEETLLSGMRGTLILDCASDWVTNSVGISGVVVCNSRTMGTAISAAVARNCYAFNPGGFALFATNAMDCAGRSSNGIGLDVDRIAINCYGESGTNVGLYTRSIGVGCYGQSTTSTGLFSGRLLTTCAGSGSPPTYAPYKYDMP